MKLSELVKGLNLPVDTDIEIAGITCDSRRVAEGWMFVCIRGSAADGHRFAADAAKAGRRLSLPRRTPDFPAVHRAFNPSGVGKICANWFGNPPCKLNLPGLPARTGRLPPPTCLRPCLRHADTGWDYRHHPEHDRERVLPPPSPRTRTSFTACLR